jgi:hypothetical protein
VFAPATVLALDAAEAELGFALPVLLRQLYSEVANGGFGPGAGLFGVKRGHRDVDGRTLSALYRAFRVQEWPPQGVLPLCDFGCGAWSCVDTRAGSDNIVTMGEVGITRTRFSLFSWLDEWASGIDIDAETFETMSATITNPFTRQPMAITQRGRAKGILIDPIPG